jgi:hypothetical protein
MSFDPDKYLESRSASAIPMNDDGFDPDKYLAKARPTSGLESGLRGAAQGALLGFADEGAGVVGAIKDKFTSDEDFSSLYEKHRDESRRNYKHARESNPMAYGAGEIGGAVASSLVPLGAASKTIGGLALAGAKLGTLGAVGASEGKNAAEVVEDAGKGLVTGAALGAAGGYVGKKASEKIPAFADWLKEIAEKRAFKSLGGLKKANDRALAKGIDRSIGRQLLDDNIVTPLASKETMASKVQEKLGETSKNYKDLIQKVANADGLDDVQRAALSRVKFTPSEVAEQLKQEVREEFSNLPEEVIAPRLKQIDQWLSSNKPMNIDEAQAFKTQMQKFIKDSSYWKDPSQSQEVLTAIRRKAKEGIERMGDEYANVSHGQSGQVRELNKKMGGLLEADDILQDKLARDQANRSVSLTDYIAGAGGLASDPGLIGGIKGLALAAGNKFMRAKGNQIAATGADAMADFLLKSPKMQTLARQNPRAFMTLANDMSRRFGGAERAMRVSANDE